MPLEQLLTPDHDFGYGKGQCHKRPEVRDVVRFKKIRGPFPQFGEQRNLIYKPTLEKHNCNRVASCHPPPMRLNIPASNHEKGHAGCQYKESTEANGRY